MSRDHSFQYITAPNGVVHIRVEATRLTLCAMSPDEDWHASTDHSGPICNQCFNRIESFVMDVMNDGKKTP